MSNLSADETMEIQMLSKGILKIEPGDLLRISLSSLQPEMNMMFNQQENTFDYNRTIMNNINSEGYLVDESGFINVPALGMVHVGGLTKQEATELLEKGIEELIVNPVVTMRFANFKVTVIGEVNNPSTFFVPTEKLNVFEAIGLAGDMTEFGLRENVILMREEGGKQVVTRLNFNHASILSSPYFHLKQNDIIYVEPDRLKAVKAGTNEKNMILLGIGVSILVPILFNFQNIFQR